jgi:histidinol-phosphatase (PHP family)
MLTTSYHTHNRYCDGKGEIAEYAEAAVAAGLKAMGVTSHSPLPFPDDHAMRVADLPAYCAEVERLRTAYRGRLRVHLSLELDYVPERQEALWAAVSRYRFDYLVGSVHFIGADAAGAPWAFDLTRDRFERGLREIFAGDVRALVAAYYERVRGLAAWSRAVTTRPGAGRVAIAGHLDLIKIWNAGDRYFREDAAWYRDEVEAALQACARAGLIVEVNTAGWREGLGAPYPSPWIVRRCVDLEIPLVVTSDAHHAAQLTAGYADAEALLREVGARAVAALKDGEWVPAPL